jgi:hypothetical protein
MAFWSVNCDDDEEDDVNCDDDEEDDVGSGGCKPLAEGTGKGKGSWANACVFSGGALGALGLTS